MSEQTTIREHLELLRNNPWSRPEEIAEHADAALAILDASTREVRRWGSDLALIVCARDGHVVIVNSTSTAPQPFPGGVCTRCGNYVKPAEGRS